MIFLTFYRYISFLLFHNKLPETLELKTLYTYYITVSIGQASRLGLVGSLIRVSQYWPGQGSHLSFKFIFPAHIIVGRIHFLVVVELRATVACRLLAGGCPQLLKASAVPCLLGFLRVVAYFIKPTRRISRSESACRHRSLR